MEPAHPGLTFALALVAGVLCQSVARRLRIPGIVLLLAAGVGLGPDGLGWVRPEALGTGLFAMVHLAVAVILFEGGLNLEISRLRRSQRAILEELARRLAHREIIGEPEWISASFVAGLKHLPLRYRLAPS